MQLLHLTLQARTIEEKTPEPTLADLTDKPGAPNLTAVEEAEELPTPAQVYIVTRIVVQEVVIIFSPNAKFACLFACLVCRSVIFINVTRTILTICMHLRIF